MDQYRLAKYSGLLHHQLFPLLERVCHLVRCAKKGKGFCYKDNSYRLCNCWPLQSASSVPSLKYWPTLVLGLANVEMNWPRDWNAAWRTCWTYSMQQLATHYMQQTPKGFKIIQNKNFGGEKIRC